MKFDKKTLFTIMHFVIKKEKPFNPLWAQFSFAESNPDAGGGMLYALRYDEERLKSSREQVASAIESTGARPKDLGEIIGISTEEISVDAFHAVQILLEELSVLNEAIEYKEGGLSARNIEDLKSFFIGSYFSLIKERNLVDAYGLVTIGIPLLIKDFKVSHAQNKTLSRRDLEALEKLQNFCVRQDNNLNKGMMVVG